MRLNFTNTKEDASLTVLEDGIRNSRYGVVIISEDEADAILGIVNSLDLIPLLIAAYYAIRPRRCPACDGTGLIVDRGGFVYCLRCDGRGRR